MFNPILAAKYLLEHPLLFVCVMWWGFIYYSAVLRAVPAAVARFKAGSLTDKVGILIGGGIAIVPCVPFFFVDVLWRFTIGALIMWDINYKNGWTFSQMLCHYFHATGWRQTEATWWSRPLNFFAPLHIS